MLQYIGKPLANIRREYKSKEIHQSGTEKPGALQYMGSRRVRYDLVTE